MSDYTKRNPMILVGHKSVEVTQKGPRVALYKEDGSANAFKLPSFKERSDFLDKFVEMVTDMDVRTVLYMLQEIDDTLGQSLQHTLSVAHAMAHDPKFNEGLDEELLCDGVTAYLTAHIEEEPEITAENSQEELLRRFFTGDTKPH